jgi:carbon monoxide dehydrogenase subunit G
MKFTNTIRINRSRDAVFAYLADLENLPRWNYAIKETRKVSAGPVRVGSEFHQIRTIPSYQEESLEVVELEPSRKLAVRGTLNTMPARLDYVLETDGDGTVLTNDVDLTARGAVALLSPIATRQIKGAVAENLNVLKQILEGSA